MELMFIIAGGIILAVLILYLLPLIIIAARFAAAIAFCGVLAGVAIWAVWAVAQDVQGLIIEVSVGAVFLIWLYFEIRSRRGNHEHDLTL